MSPLILIGNVTINSQINYPIVTEYLTAIAAKVIFWCFFVRFWLVAPECGVNADNHKLSDSSFLSPGTLCKGEGNVLTLKCNELKSHGMTCCRYDKTGSCDSYCTRCYQCRCSYTIFWGFHGSSERFYMWGSLADPDNSPALSCWVKVNLIPLQLIYTVHI